MRKGCAPGQVFIVEPRLWSAEGHEFDHVVEFARGIRAANPTCGAHVLIGPADEELVKALASEPALTSVVSLFPRRMLGDSSPSRALVRAAFRDSQALRTALRRQAGTREVVLFFSSLALYHLLLLAFLRRMMGGWRIRAVGIFRYDPLDAEGQLIRKYRVLTSHPLARMIWRTAIHDTLIYTDTPQLQQALHDFLGVDAGMAPIPVSGIWDLPEVEWAAPAASGGPVTVGYVGQPRPSRAFDLFTLAALLMEEERHSGKVQFLAVMPPGSDSFWNTHTYGHLLRAGLRGVALDERWMSAVEFARQMNRADIVWALGDAAIYRRQSSGVFAHAVCLGKRVLTNRGGWAEAVLGSTPMVRYVDAAIEQVVPALRDLVASGEDMAYQKVAGAWRQAHSREAFHVFVKDALTRCQEC